MMPMSRTVSQARERACIDGGNQGARFLAIENRRAALGDDVFRPAHRVRRVHVDNLADHEPIKQHAYRGQALLYGRFGESRKQALHIARDMDGLYMRQLAHAPFGAESRELTRGIVIGSPCVLVTDIRGEEIEEPLRRLRLLKKQRRGGPLLPSASS